jgi:SAM-dependent methyltransferase
MEKMYDELAAWWFLLSPPADYEEEAAAFLELLQPASSKPNATLLELGSGGGNNASHLRAAFASLTLVDLSPHMLDMSRQLNPTCEHLVGDMRTIRLERTFDAVFIHDAIDYMMTLDDLRAALTSAFVHCAAGGMALIVPDHIRETFEDDSDHGGHDGDDGRSLRYLEWTYDPDPTDSTCVTDYVFIVRQDDQPSRVIHDQHTHGLFALAQWQAALQDVGFARVEVVIDEYERHLFVAHKD